LPIVNYALVVISAEYCPVVSVAYSAHLARRDRDWIALHPLAGSAEDSPKLFTLMATAFVDMLGLLDDSSAAALSM